MISESSNTATLVAWAKSLASYNGAGADEIIRNALREVADALSTLAKELEEARAEVERVTSDRQYVIGWNDGFTHVHGPLRFPTILRKMWSGGEVQAWLDAQRIEAARQAAADEGSELSEATRQRDEALAALTAAEAREGEMKRVLEKFAGRIDEIEQVKAVSKFATEGTAAVKLSLLREARAVLATKEMGHG